MNFALGNCVEPTRSISEVSIPSDVKVCFTIEEIKALAQDYHAQNFEHGDDVVCQTTRHLEFRKRDVNIMLKMLYAIEQYEGQSHG
jgi:uncharacterized protein YsxB (DUF464 family)